MGSLQMGSLQAARLMYLSEEAESMCHDWPCTRHDAFPVILPEILPGTKTLQLQRSHLGAFCHRK